MKGRILDRVVAAEREHRSVALATDLATGRQLLFEGEHAEGDLALDDAALDRVREAWRTGRNRTIETASGRVFVEVLTPPNRCFIIGAVRSQSSSGCRFTSSSGSVSSALIFSRSFSCFRLARLLVVIIRRYPGTALP